VARKQRDYKAEYAAAKARATRAGYKSEREYKRVRKELKLPPRTSPVPKRIVENVKPGITADMSQMRRECQRWSDGHSRVDNSKYRPTMTNDQVRRYHKAFVEKPKGKTRKERSRNKYDAIHDYIVPDLMDEQEWERGYPWI